MALLQIVYCKNNIQCLYTLLLRHLGGSILLKIAQVSIAVLAIRKEWLKLKLQVIQQVYDCSFATG